MRSSKRATTQHHTALSSIHTSDRLLLCTYTLTPTPIPTLFNAATLLWVALAASPLFVNTPAMDHHARLD